MKTNQTNERRLQVVVRPSAETVWRAVMWDLQVEHDRVEQLARSAEMDPNAAFVDLTDPHVGDGAKLAVLNEKVGDIGHGVLGLGLDEDAKQFLRRNLVELATAAANWAASLS